MKSMYRSRQQFEKKIVQAKYVLKVMQKYRGKVFVNNGVDQETGAHPLQVNISSFLAHTRSALQYAYKECKERNETSVYDATLKEYPLIAVFRDLRNTDIHDRVIGTHTIISAEVQMYKEGDERLKESEKNPVQAKITSHLSRPLDITDELIEQLRLDGREDMLEAIESGNPLYEAVEHKGEQDLYILCEQYLSDIETFAKELQQCGVMS